MRRPLRACKEGLPRPRVARARRMLGSFASLYLYSHFLGFGHRFFDRADHVECLFR